MFVTVRDRRNSMRRGFLSVVMLRETGLVGMVDCSTYNGGHIKFELMKWLRCCLKVFQCHSLIFDRLLRKLSVGIVMWHTNDRISKMTQSWIPRSCVWVDESSKYLKDNRKGGKLDRVTFRYWWGSGCLAGSTRVRNNLSRVEDIWEEKS